MTKKSTEAHVLDLHRAGKLTHHDRALWPDDTCIRRLWLHPNVKKWASTPGESSAERDYFAQVRAFFSAFVAGSDFDDDDMLKALSQGKHGIWEFRITFRPQARVLGAFLRNGEFVALAHSDRGDLAKAGFGPLIKVVRDRWKALFPNHEPLKGFPRSALLEEFDGDL